jgi:hypothetical protein
VEVEGFSDRQHGDRPWLDGLPIADAQPRAARMGVVKVLPPNGRYDERAMRFG